MRNGGHPAHPGGWAGASPTHEIRCSRRTQAQAVVVKGHDVGAPLDVCGRRRWVKGVGGEGRGSLGLKARKCLTRTRACLRYGSRHGAALQRGAPHSHPQARPGPRRTEDDVGKRSRAHEPALLVAQHARAVGKRQAVPAAALAVERGGDLLVCLCPGDVRACRRARPPGAKGPVGGRGAAHAAPALWRDGCAAMPPRVVPRRLEGGLPCRALRRAPNTARICLMGMRLQSAPQGWPSGLKSERHRLRQRLPCE
jgi:hypothetical protein